MISRRLIISSIMTSPVLAISAKLFAGVTSAQSAAPSYLTWEERDPDRELHCSLSDLNQLHWTYASQYYSENKNTLWINEGERIKVTIINELASDQSFQLIGLPSRVVSVKNQNTNHLQKMHSITNKVLKVLKPQSELVVEINATDPLANAFIGVDGGELLPIQIRPCDQPHPLVA